MSFFYFQVRFEAVDLETKHLLEPDQLRESERRSGGQGCHSGNYQLGQEYSNKGHRLFQNCLLSYFQVRSEAVDRETKLLLESLTNFVNRRDALVDKAVILATTN